MPRKLAGFLVSGAFVLASGAALGHHSFAMFDQQNLIELEGAVKEFRYSAPHAFIILDVSRRTALPKLGSSKVSVRARSRARDGRARPSAPAIR